MDRLALVVDRLWKLIDYVTRGLSVGQGCRDLQNRRGSCVIMPENPLFLTKYHVNPPIITLEKKLLMKKESNNYLFWKKVF
jgi:hypothetical protein